MDGGVFGVQLPWIAADPSGLYYEVNVSDLSPGSPPGGSTTGKILRAAADGGAPSPVAIVVGGGAQAVQGFVLTSTNVVFSQAGDGSDSGAAIVGASRTDGSVHVLAGVNGAPGPVVADEQYAYFADRDGTKRVPLDGGAPLLLSRHSAISLTLAAPDILLADYVDGGLFLVPTAGGQENALATQERPFFAVACGPQEFCWINGGVASASLDQVKLGGTPMLLSDDPSLVEPHALAFDGLHFYVAAGAGGTTLVRISRDGSDVTTVASMGGMSAVAVDEDCVYWASFSGIYSAEK